jgi:hypothetical protein
VVWQVGISGFTDQDCATTHLCNELNGTHDLTFLGGFWDGCAANVTYEKVFDPPLDGVSIRLFINNNSSGGTIARTRVDVLCGSSGTIARWESTSEPACVQQGGDDPQCGESDVGILVSIERIA